MSKDELRLAWQKFRDSIKGGLNRDTIEKTSTAVSDTHIGFKAGFQAGRDSKGDGWCFDMDKAPRDKSILGLISNVDISLCPSCSLEDGRLCIYHSHAEGVGHVRTKYAVIEWGGGFDDSTYEYPNAGAIPDWWFLQDGDYETVANPIAWRSIDPPQPPKDRKEMRDE